MHQYMCMMPVKETKKKHSLGFNKHSLMIKIVLAWEASLRFDVNIALTTKGFGFTMIMRAVFIRGTLF